MSKLLLIHGYGTGLKIPGVREHYGITAGFRAFREDIVAGTAKVFRWDIRKDIPQHQVGNPAIYRAHYQEEREKASQPETLQALHKMITEESPEIILCHSLGCQLLLNMVAKHGLPECVKQIMFSQADIDRDTRIENADARQRLESGALTWTNYYCPWDITLLVGAIHHRKMRAGIFGSKDPLIKNTFFALTIPPNLHMSALRSKKFRDKILKNK